jgi:biopolymer transport protein ExbD/biopolymer transport protein TolR
VVSIDRAQTVYLGNEPVNIHQLGAKLKSQMGDQANDAVFLRCDESVPFGSFAMVMDALRQAGITNISIVTEPLTQRSTPQ